MIGVNIKPSRKKILSDLIGNPARSILVIASIAVGVFAVGAIAGAYFIIPADMNASFSSANPANIDIQTDPFDLEFLDSVSHFEGIKKAQGHRKVTVQLKNSNGDWSSFDLFASSDFSSARINYQLPILGVQEPGDQQVILEKKTAKRWQLQPGDILQIELDDGTIRYMPVVGISQDLTSGVGGMFNNNKGYITFDTLEWLHAPKKFTQLVLTVSKNENKIGNIQQVANSLIDKLKRSGRNVYFVGLAEKNKHPMDSILQALLRILLILGILIVFLSGSLISNTLSALLAQHRQQIGIMKLIGARSPQIIRMYLALILSYGIVALLIAIPLGGSAAFGLSEFAGGLIGFPIRGFRVVPLAIVIQIIISLGVPVIASILPLRNVALVSVHAAINTESRETSKIITRGLLDRTITRIKWVSRPLLISFRNTFRRKGRLALTLLTLTLGGAIFISVFNVQVSLNSKINQITKYFRADVNVDFNRTYPVKQIQSILDKFPGVARIEPWMITQGKILRTDDTVIDSFTLLAPPTDTILVVPIIMQGRWLNSTDEAVITVNEAFLKKYPGLKLGDSIYMKVGDQKKDWKIAGVFQFTGNDDLLAYANYDYLTNILNLAGRTATYRIASKNHDLVYQTSLSENLSQYLRDNGFHINKIEAGATFTASVTEYISILTAFLVVMAILTAVVGSIGMAGTLSMNVMERTREIGIMRAIGAHDRVVLQLILVEGLLIGFISFIFSSILSFPITSLLAEVVSQAIFNSPANFAFTAQGFGIWFVVMLFLSVLSSIVPARSASRMTIREVLAYE